MEIVLLLRHEMLLVMALLLVMVLVRNDSILGEIGAIMERMRMTALASKIAS